MILDLGKDIAKWAFPHTSFQNGYTINSNDNFMGNFIKIIIFVCKQKLGPWYIFAAYFLNNKKIKILQLFNVPII